MRPTQWKPLAQRSLVDLDDADTGLFQIQHLLADGQCQLPAGRGTRLIIPHERPVQHRHRTGEHALHRAFRERLCMLRPGNRHRMRTADVTEQDGRLHTARPIGLHPAKAAEGIAFQLLAEILHHVVTLGLAMHQHVQAQRFLLTHTAGHLGLHGLLVGRRINLASLELTTCLADLGRLRERADGGSGKRRQLEAGPLALRPHRIGALAHRCRPRGALSQRCLYRRVVDTRRTTARLDRLAMGRQLDPHGISPFMDGTCQQAQLIQLLARKGQPRLQLGIQPVLAGQIHWHMQQRARRRQPQPITQP